MRVHTGTVTKAFVKPSAKLRPSLGVNPTFRMPARAFRGFLSSLRCSTVEAFRHVAQLQEHLLGFVELNGEVEDVVSVLYTRLLAVLLAMTYFGWVWVVLSFAWMLAYGSPPWKSVTEWQAIEGEVYLYALAMVLPAVVLSAVSVGVLIRRSALLVKLIAALSACQIPLILWSAWWEMGSIGTTLAVAVILGLALSVIVLAYIWHHPCSVKGAS